MLHMVDVDATLEMYNEQANKQTYLYTVLYKHCNMLVTRQSLD
jgi:hypothetical protein